MFFIFRNQNNYDTYKIQQEQQISLELKTFFWRILKIFNFFGAFIIFIILFNLITIKSSRSQTFQNKGSKISSSFISIELDTSRTEVSAGVGLSITAKISNNSDQTLYFREDSLTLTYPLELEGPYQDQYGYQSFFPTETDKEISSVIQLSPGNAYTVIWGYTPIPTSITYSNPFKYTWEILKNEFFYIFFQPGDYKIALNIKYWFDSELPKTEYKTDTESVVINVKAPQSIILLGAAIGGICAYYLSKFTNSSTDQKYQNLSGSAENDNYIKESMPKYLNIIVYVYYFLQRRIFNLFIGLRDISGAMLLSGIVTILLSRIADTQFIVSVKVEDFWGAIATGFVANYAGTSFLKKLIGDSANKSLNNDSSKNYEMIRQEDIQELSKSELNKKN